MLYMQAVLEAGDVQWITTGKGVIHAVSGVVNNFRDLLQDNQRYDHAPIPPSQEMPEGKDVCHVLQIWLNLPSKHKGEAAVTCSYVDNPTYPAAMQLSPPRTRSCAMQISRE
jgi:hypothetical protein